MTLHLASREFLSSVPKSYNFNHLKVLFGVYPQTPLAGYSSSCAFSVDTENRRLTLPVVKYPLAHVEHAPIPPPPPASGFLWSVLTPLILEKFKADSKRKGLSGVRVEATLFLFLHLSGCQLLPGRGLCGTPGTSANPDGPGTRQGNTCLSPSSRHTQASCKVPAPAPALLRMREKNTKKKSVPNLNNRNNIRLFRRVGLFNIFRCHLRGLHRPRITSKDVSCWPNPRRAFLSSCRLYPPPVELTAHCLLWPSLVLAFLCAVSLEDRSSHPLQVRQCGTKHWFPKQTSVQVLVGFSCDVFSLASYVIRMDYTL